MVENHSDTVEIGDEFTVHRLGYGAMRLCGEEIIGRPDDEESARDVLEQAVDVGVNIVDTADSYGPGVSERLIGETLGDPDDVVVATKGGLLRNADGDWIPHGDPDYLRNAVLASLDRHHRPLPVLPPGPGHALRGLGNGAGRTERRGADQRSRRQQRDR